MRGRSRYSYCGSHMAVAPDSYYSLAVPPWVEELSPAQRAVLAPPYYYGRELVEPDGQTTIFKEHDGTQHRSSAVASSSCHNGMLRQ